MSFFLYPGNKLETLAGICCQLIGNDPGSDPMAQETIVVQTQGMAAYLRQFFARRNGIAANIQMPFPAGFIAGILKQNIPDFEAASEYFSQEQLAWEIFSILQENRAEFPELASFITGTSDAVFKCWQLANRIASLFDRYQIYRYQDEYFPLKQDEWQSRLWRKLQHKYGKSKMQCCREFLTLDRPLKGLPRRLTVFGVGSLPPLYLDIFFKIAQESDLRFFYMTPCREYWEHLYSAKEQKWLCKGDEMPEAGNPLLASWGASGRELFANLLKHQDRLPYVSSEELLFEDYLLPDENNSILQRLQQDIFTMADGRSEPLASGGDGSVEILNCYAPHREVEVLHDKLLTLFNDRKVEPGDVIVMAPDINCYLPYIEAVFGRGPLKNCYGVSDRSLHSGGGVSAVFRRFLELSGCRMTVDDVMGILNNSFVCCRRGIALSDLPVIARWHQESGVRWGMDGRDHEKHCSVAFEEYSWFNTMDRMFEVFARGRNQEEVLAELPDALPEAEMELFGKFNRFLRDLADFRNQLAGNYTLAEWMTMLQNCLDRFFCGSDGDSAGEIAMLNRFFNEKKFLASKLEVDTPLPETVILDMLDGFLNTAQDRFSFLRGKITFCSLTPLRSIPAKVIAVLGLDEGAFPRRDVELGFDLMASKLLPGDRSGAKEDRYLFLEALMSARENFWCFYNGRSRQTGKKLESSVILDELQEYLLMRFNIGEVLHFLHGFDVRYYSGNGGFMSWSQENFRTATLLNGERQQTVPRCSELDAMPHGEFRHCTLEELIAWAAHPAEYLFKNDLNVRFSHPEELSETESIVHCNGLERYRIRSIINNFEKNSIPEEPVYQLMKSSNLLPPGEAGFAEFKKELRVLRQIPVAWRQAFYAQERMALSFDIGTDENKVTVSGIFECSPALDRQNIITFSSLKHKNYISAFMRHLALCAISDAPEVTTSFYFCEKGRWKEILWYREESNFWHEFMQMRIRFDKRIPAVFPQTMFELCTAGAARRKTIMEQFTSICQSERNSDPVLRRCFAANAMDDAALRDEFFSFARLFYRFV